MFDEKKFRAAVILSGHTIKEIADQMRISPVTLYRKMSGESDFYREEIQRFCEITKTNNPAEIFFATQLT